MECLYSAKSRNLFRSWTSHDLADHGPELGSSTVPCYVRVDFDWMADGLYERFRSRVRSGIEPEDEDFDLETSDFEGLEIATEIRPFLGSNCYGEYRPLRERVVRDGEAVEPEVPRLIMDLSR